MTMYLIIARIYDPANSLVNRPPFYIALATMIMGTQLFLAGFLGELIARNAPGRNAYLIEQKLGVE